MKNDPFMTLLVSARTRLDEGDPDRALRINDEIIKKFPERPFAWIQRARILLALDRYRSASECVEKSVLLCPGNPDASVHYVTLLSVFCQHEHIDAFHGSLTNVQRNHPLLMAALAEIYAFRGDVGRALECIECAISAKGISASLLFQRARVMTFTGDFHLAIKDFEHCLKLDPSESVAHLHLARIKESGDRSSEVRNALESHSLTEEQKATLLFALHYHEHNAGRYKLAENALENACRVRRSLLRYSENEASEIFLALERRSFPAGLSVEADTDDKTPVFIVGMHRSGTTLLEYLLSHHPDIAVCGEIYDFPEKLRRASDHNARAPLDLGVIDRVGDGDLAGVGKAYLSSASYLAGNKQFFTDKLPSNFMNVGFITGALPKAKVIWISRDPIATCFSNLREMFSEQTNPFSYDAGEMARYYVGYERIMQHWLRVFGERILRVNYEDLVRDSDAVLTGIMRFCGLQETNAHSRVELDERGRGIATASAYKVREPVSSPEIPDWFHYERFMAPALEVLHGET